MPPKKRPVKSAKKPVKNRWEDIESKMQDLTEIVMPIITTIYGKPGSGKTTVLSCFPKPIMIISVKDKGTESAKSDELEYGDIKVFEVKHFDEVLDYLEYALEGPTSWGTVAIDHMTALQKKSHDKVKKEENRDKMSQPMFGTSSDNLKEVIDMMVELTDLGVQPVFICQDRFQSGEGEGEDQLLPEVGPNLMPKLSTYLCATCRLILHTYLYESVDLSGPKPTHNIDYRVRTGPNPYYITKMTRPKGTQCPQFLVHDLSKEQSIFDDLMKIVKGEWVNEKPRKKKKRTTGRRRK